MDPQQDAEVPDAEAVQRMKGGGYTYELPLELWGAIIEIVWVLLLLGWLVRRLRR